MLKLRENKHFVSKKHLGLLISEVFRNSLMVIGITLLHTFNWFEKCE
jgi:hypothetical protein